ncbi:MAG: hypothetical protein PHZ09_03820 [Eubacteriales bacterium]|nr:hypothetical protein [Eubacteriales bacterium]
MERIPRVLALLLVFSLLIPFASCSDNTAAPGGDNNGTDTAQTDTDPGDTRVYPELPDYDARGAVVTVVNIDYSIPIWAQRDIWAEEINGEIINDAVFRRNSTIQEKYNLSIVSQPELDQAAVINRANAAADGSVDLATVSLKTFASLAGAGALVELNAVPHINLDMSWYDPSSVECLSIANKLYGVCSDYTIMDNDATTAMVFNKKLLDDFNLENPYNLANTGAWTLDKLIEMSANISSDINGDGVMDDNDRYGLLYQRDTMSSFYNGCGGIIAAKDGDDLPVMFLQTEESMAILDRLYDYLYDEEVCFHVMKFFDPKPEGFTDGMTRMFQANSALFMWIRMADVENLRTMQVDFGILPIPKLDAKQERYYHSVNPYVGATVIIPKSSPDLERTGIFIEAISAESKYILEPVYYDIMLTTKITRDNESADMLDIIFGTRIYDNGEIYDFGTIGSDLIYMTMTYNRDMASTYAKKEKQIAKAIEKVINQFTREE